MGEISNLLDVYSEYIPTQVFIMYHNIHREVYIENYDIKDKKLMYPKPVVFEDIEEIVDKINKSKIKKKRIISENNLIYDVLPPDNVLFLRENPLKLCWYIPAGKYKFKFRKTLDIKGTVFEHPGILFMLNARLGINFSFRVYTIKDKRPKLTTKLYSPPFFNCNSDGGICMPSEFHRINNIRKLSVIMRFIQMQFFDSDFSHVGEQTIKNEDERGLVKLWRKLGRGGKFPLDELSNTGLTIKDLLYEKNSLHI